MAVFSLGTEWWQIVIRSSVVYLFVVLALKATGRRSLGQRNAIDLVLILIVANAVQNAMIGSDTSLIGGLIAAATLFAIDVGFDKIIGRDGKARDFFAGSPIVVINHGQLIEANMRHAHIDRNEIEEVLREHGYDSLAAVKTGIVEMDGTLSIVPSTSETVHLGRKTRPRRKSSVTRS